jgi:hypothetical protein
LFGISDYKFQVALDFYQVPTVYKRKGKSFLQPWKEYLEIWFLNMISWFCNIMPNSNSSYLPVYFTKASMYEVASMEYQT